MRAALVVTTYNNPRYLGICLRSLTNQSCRDFDVFVADDGSTEPTRARIDALRPELAREGIRLEHHWHPDTGYRKAAINNEVFRHLEGYPLTICVDHDTIAHHRFVEDHLSAHADGGGKSCFMGRRTELGPRISASLTEENVTSFNRGFGIRLLRSWLCGETKGAQRAIRVSGPRLQRWLGRDRVTDLLGSNFSVATRLLFEVNGYNEDFQSYWGEDGDLFVRLRNSGARITGCKGFAVQYHLDHPRLEPDARSQARYRELLQDAAYRRCANGISKDDPVPFG